MTGTTAGSWAEVGALYSTGPVLTGLALVVTVAVLLAFRRTRKAGWVLVPLLVVFGLIGMHVHGAAGGGS